MISTKLSHKKQQITSKPAFSRAFKELQASPERPDSRHGTYVLILRVEAACRVKVGKMGEFDFPKGYLLYVGSALGGGGVRARVRRHLNPEAKLHWNIDHVRTIAHPVEVWWAYSEKKIECSWSQLIRGQAGNFCPVKGLGSHDCATCTSHLYHAKRLPDFRKYGELLHTPLLEDVPVYRMQL